MVSLKDEQLVMKNPSCQILQGGVISTKNRGGWITLPFIIGSIMGLSLAGGSWYANLTAFLIKEYNITNAVANRIYNIMNIGVNLLPIFGALVADSFVGSILVINVASFSSLLGLIMLGLSTTIIPSLRPQPCNDIITDLITNNTNCQSPSGHQYAFLLAALFLATIGFGCTRFLLGSLGASQFDKPEHRRIFFNVYILGYEVCWSISNALAIFTFQDQKVISWKISLLIGIIGNIIGIILFIFGSQYYRHINPKANPIISMVRVLVLLLSNAMRELGTRSNKSSSRVYNDEYPSLEIVHGVLIPSKSHRFDRKSNSLDTAELDDLKRLTKIIPIWSCGILLNTAVATSTILVVLQASSMDLTIIGPHTKIPAAFIPVISFVFTALTLSMFDRVLFPTWRKVVGRPLKPLQRSGVGHVFVILGLIGLALVETGRRLNSIKTHHHLTTDESLSAWWLVFPLALLGIGAGYYFPGGLTFFYQEFPKSLKNTSTAVPSVQIMTGFYLSKVLVNVVKHKTSWLPNDDVNLGRLDVAYGVLAIIAALNFGYFLICSHFYKYNNIQDTVSDGEVELLPQQQPQPQP